MKASKLPYKSFDYNIRRAEALARLDSYLEDLMYNEGKGTIKPLFKIPNELMQVLGIDKVMDRTLKRVGQKMKKEFQTESKQKGKEHFERIAKDYVKQLEPRLQKISKMFEDLELLMDQTLLEQALIAAVSAFEVYLRELAVSVTTLNPSIRKRFYSEINKAIDATKLEEYEQNAELVQGEIVADLIELGINSIKSFLRRLLNLENAFNDPKTELNVCKIFQTRHVIVHRAGFADPKFRKITKSKGGIGIQIKLSRRFVLSSIKILRDVVQRIETHIHQQRTP